MSGRKVFRLMFSLVVALMFLFVSLSGLGHRRAVAYQGEHAGIVSLTALSPEAHGQAGITQTWENMGLYGATVSAIAIDPVSNVPTGTVYVGATAGSGLYRSDDGGLSWTGVYTPASVQALAVDTVNDIVWARTSVNQVITSADRGQTWYAVTNLPSHLVAIHDIVVSGSLVFIGGDRMVARSDDAGATWTTAPIPYTAPGQGQLRLALDKLKDRIFAASDNEIYVSPISAMSFITSSGGVTSSHGIHNIISIAASPHIPDLLFVGTGDTGLRALYRSTDGGVSWTQIFQNGPAVGYIVFHPVHTQTVYAGGQQSADGGVSFTPLGNGAGNSHLAIYPTNPYTMFGAVDQGINRSTNGGANFQPVNEGLDGVVVQAVAQNPRDLGLFFVSTNSGAGRTFDAGKTWEFPLGVSSHFGDAVLAPYEKVTDTAKVYMGEFVSSNYADNITTLGSPSLRSLIENSGCTGQCAAFINAIAANPANDDHLYAASGGFHIPPGGDRELPFGGMWESTDGGTTWVSNTLDYVGLYGTLPYTTPVRTVLFATNDLAYAALGDFRGEQELSPGMYGGVISRTTGGNWQLLSTITNPITSVVEALAVDPNDPQHLWVGTGPPSPGLYQTLDGGISWEKRQPPVGGVFQAVAIHPRIPSIVFAAVGKDVYRSDDSGLHWTIISSPPSSAEPVESIFLPVRPPASVHDLTGTVHTFSGTGTGTFVNLSWVAPADPRFQGVHIRGDDTNPPRTSIEGTSLATLPAAQLTATISLPNDPYYVTVFPYDRDGRYGVGASLMISGTSVTPAQPPGPPPVAAATLRAAGTVHLAAEDINDYLFAGTDTGLYRIALGELGAGSQYTVYLPLLLRGAP
jgi:photosystem II stability/assembly factor-like uncharacterized protein